MARKDAYYNIRKRKKHKRDERKRRFHAETDNPYVQIKLKAARIAAQELASAEEDDNRKLVLL